MPIKAPSVLDTATAKMMEMDQHTSEPLLTDGQVEERLPPGLDAFSLTPTERKQYGVRPEEEHHYIRNPNIWMAEEKADAFVEFCRRHPGARIITHDGARVMVGDMMLVAYPREQKERLEARSVQSHDGFWDAIERRDFDEDSDPYRRDAEEVKEESREQAAAQGWVGINSPTAGMDYESAARRYTEEQIIAEEARYRRGPRVDYDPVALKRQESEEANRAAPRAAQRQYFGTGNNPIGPQSRAERVQRVAAEQGRRVPPNRR